MQITCIKNIIYLHISHTILFNIKKKQKASVSADYAIFQTGGKQYQAVVGKTIAVEKLDAEEGITI